MQMLPWRTLATAAIITSWCGLRAQVVLNEVCVTNMNGLEVTDPFNGGQDREDWVELYNTGGSAVDLSGWYLSDNDALPTKWTFPAGATIPANGYLVVLCSGWNGQYGGYWCTNFKLTQTSEEPI
ncbi:MAG TPA: lamin tail domain-containing protein, partial [Flavobacteriales bacterium]|nr:lamin tail domain-containing protein [Flavobacteriales bacterium]